MKILNRNEHVEKKPAYTWSAGVVLSIKKRHLENLDGHDERSNLNKIWSNVVPDSFSIVHE